MIAISHTRLQVFHTCPRQFAGKYVWKTIVDTGGPAADYGNMIHESIAAYLEHGLPKALHADVLWLKARLDKLRALPGEHLIERRYAVDREVRPCPWYDRDDPERAWLRVIFDYAIIDGTGAVVLDWKTGKKRPVDHDAQSKLYAAAVFALFPDVTTVTVTFLFTKTKETYTIDYVRTDYRTLLADAVDAFEEIEACEADEMWPAKPGVHCRWCGDQTCTERKG